MGTRVVRPKLTESTALGAAYLAGLAIGFWENHELEGKKETDKEFKPEMEKTAACSFIPGLEKSGDSLSGLGRLTSNFAFSQCSVVLTPQSTLILN